MLALSSFSIYGFFNGISNNAENQISFEEVDLNEALELAESQQKMIFVSFYTSWCRSCKLMRNNVFTDQDVAHFYNDNYVNLYLNGDKAEGQQLIENFGIQSFPSYAFLKPDGELIGIFEGVLLPEKFLELGKSAFEKGLE
jgi:thiol:disulfide interchange protein